MNENLYFAYGSNMNPGQMEDRCPGAEAAGPALLDGWEVRIGERGFATIVEAPCTETWGVLWQVTPADVRELDRFEGVARGLYHPEVVIVRGVGSACSARAYIEDFAGDGDPSSQYCELILEGARHFNLPEDYCSTLAALGRP